MCCRYFMEESPELRPFVEAASRSVLRDRMVADLARPLRTHGEIRPTDMVPVVAPDQSGKRAAFPMVWGYSGKTSCLFNARSESAAEKPMWKESMERRRCIIPASYYFEWQHLVSPDGKKKTGDKYIIQPKGSSLTLLAGIYRIENGFPHFAILTRSSGEDLGFIHDRMPVILSAENADAWISLNTSLSFAGEILKTSVTDMVFEKA